MNEPISELIRRNVIETLKGVTVAAGYRHTLSVEPRRQWGNTTTKDANLQVKKCLVWLGDEEDVSDEYGTTTHTFKRLHVHVLAYAWEEETSEQDIDEILNTLAADMERAMCAPRNTDDSAFDRGGYAFETRLLGIGRDQGGESDDGPAPAMVAMVFVVDYRHAINDQYQQS